MASENFSEKITDLLRDNKIKKALSLLRNEAKDEQTIDEIRFQAAVYADLLKQEKRRNLSGQDASFIKNRIVTGILSLVKEVENQQLRERNAASPKPLSLVGQHPRQIPKNLTQVPFLDARLIIGRDKELTELKKTLTEAQILAVAGTGGTGKTMLARAFITRFSDEYDHLVWINQSRDIKEAFVSNQELLVDVINKKSYDALFKDVLDLFQNLKKKVLIVIDNVDASILEYLEQLRAASSCQILLTTRVALDGIRMYPLPALKPAAAKQLFYRRYRREADDSRLAFILNKLDYHPLAVSVLASVAHKRRIPLARLEADIREQSEKDEGENMVSRVFTALEFSPLEWWTIQQFLLTPPFLIPYPVLRDLFAIDGRPKPTGRAFPEVLDSLAEKGVLHYDAESDAYQMHKVLQEVFLKKHRPAATDFRKITKNLVEKLWISHYYAISLHKAKWIPFGEHLIHLGGPKAKLELAELKVSLALNYRVLGEYDKAKSLMERLLAQKGEIDISLLAWVENCLGLIYQDLGDYQAARRLLLQSLERNREVYGEDSINYARLLSNVSCIQTTLGEIRDAKAHLLEAKEIYELAGKTRMKDYATICLNLGSTYFHMGRYPAALTYTDQGLALLREKFGSEEPDFARGLANKGVIKTNQGDYAEAIALLEQAIEIEKRFFSNFHPRIGIRKINLATALAKKGQSEKAQEHLREAHHIFVSFFDEDHHYARLVARKLEEVVPPAG